MGKKEIKIFASISHKTNTHPHTWSFEGFEFALQIDP